MLGHEISHVTHKHTVNAIQKGKLVQVGADVSRNQFVEEYGKRAYEMTLENKFDRDQEEKADKSGLALANKLGYAPSGLNAFLARLADRNKGLQDRSGMFASHPETQDRIDKMTKQIKGLKPAGTATVTARYHEHIVFKPVPLSDVSAGVAGAAGLAEGGSSKSSDKDKKDDKSTSTGKKPSGGGFGLGSLLPTSDEKTSNQTIASAGARGVNPDRDAKGGPNKNPVVVTITPAELAAFRTGIVG